MMQLLDQLLGACALDQFQRERSLLLLSLPLPWRDDQWHPPFLPHRWTPGLQGHLSSLLDVCEKPCF
jgi:hypothetical protein